MEFTNEQMMQLFQMFINALHQSTPIAPPAPVVKTGDINPATGLRVIGKPDGLPPEPVGWDWMGAFDPSGTWREKWVYVGVQHAVGVGIQQGESPTQYAQRMGVPAGLLPTMTSAQAVDKYLHDTGAK